MSDTHLIVLGMHRSGTSSVVRVLAQLGFSLGPEEDIIPPHEEDNPEGYWENQKVIDLNNDLFKTFGGTYQNLPTLTPGWESDDRLNELVERGREIVSSYPQQGLWCIKDPRIMVTLPFWRKLLPEARLILVLRNPIEVARSLVQRDYDLLNFAEGLSLWLDYHQALLGSTSLDGVPIVRHERLMADPVAELAAALAQLDIEVSRKDLVEACGEIKPGLHRSRASSWLLDAISLPPQIKDTYVQLWERGGDKYGADDPAPTAEEKLEGVRRFYASLAQREGEKEAYLRKRLEEYHQYSLDLIWARDHYKAMAEEVGSGDLSTEERAEYERIIRSLALRNLPKRLLTKLFWRKGG